MVQEDAISEFVRTALILVCIPTLAILVPALLTWIRDLDALARRTRRLDEQTKIVSFWDTWMKTVASISPVSGHTEKRIMAVRREALSELVTTGHSVLSIYRRAESRASSEFKLGFEEFRQFRASLPWLRRAFLLYKAPNSLAKLWKTGFYIYVVSTFIVIPYFLLIQYYQIHPVELSKSWYWIFRSGLTYPFNHPLSRARAISYFTFIFFYQYAFVFYSRKRSIKYEWDRTYFPTITDLRRRGKIEFTE